MAVVLDGMDLTNAQWAVLEPTFRPRRRPDGRGRPWADPRAVMNGVLWVLRTGAPWHDLPPRYPPYQTCHRRFQQWQRSGRLDRLLQRLAEDLRDRGMRLIRFGGHLPKGGYDVQNGINADGTTGTAEVL